MTTYSINIDYTTGNSQYSERTQDEVGMNWQNIDQAKKALASIAEHHDAYVEATSYRRYDSPPFDLKSIQDKPWYHGPIDDSFPDSWHRTLVVEKDDGSKFAIDVFWEGHFETLHVAEVCIAASDTENNDMRIFF
eukprot:gnl/Spiro4/26167_TR13041_c0_g1_i1.p3 gnl/Spiro4/26167_TR13041_c0_g1~~gnl/Spiro4/26167_TR13041_c0_g1_i1.p3  ORF type:complete len:135 (+),score=8.55 gnl/Spiro4/26167_TR13041_c0_g1_i1:3643-4047(+)